MIHMMRFSKAKMVVFPVTRTDTAKQLLTPIKSGKTTDEKKKNKKEQKIIWIGIAVAIGFIVYIDLAEKDDYWDYSASSEDVYPLKEAGLTTTGPVDLEKPLKVTIEQNKLLFNQGYQIEIIGDADIETSGGKNFLILPSTEEYPDTKYLGNISFMKKETIIHRQVCTFLAILSTVFLII